MEGVGEPPKQVRASILYALLNINRVYGICACACAVRMCALRQYLNKLSKMAFYTRIYYMKSKHINDMINKLTRGANLYHLVYLKMYAANVLYNLVFKQFQMSVVGYFFFHSSVSSFISSYVIYSYVLHLFTFQPIEIFPKM